jgi:hypothetical protein
VRRAYIADEDSGEQGLHRDVDEIGRPPEGPARARLLEREVLGPSYCHFFHLQSFTSLH